MPIHSSGSPDSRGHHRSLPEELGLSRPDGRIILFLNTQMTKSKQSNTVQRNLLPWISVSRCTADGKSILERELMWSQMGE